MSEIEEKEGKRIEKIKLHVNTNDIRKNNIYSKANNNNNKTDGKLIKIEEMKKYPISGPETTAEVYPCLCKPTRALEQRSAYFVKRTRAFRIF